MNSRNSLKSSDSFQERMANRPLRDLYQGSEDLWGYRASAATLASFQIDELQPFQADSSPQARAQLLVECDAVTSENGRTRWSLRTPIRQTTLRRLFESGSLLSALQANSKRDDSPTQRIFEAYIDPNAPAPPLPKSLEEAGAMLEVSYWLQAVPVIWQRIPPRESLRKLIAREQLLEPFRTLVGDHFAGRKEELDVLSDYVGVFAARQITEKLTRAFETIFSIVERPPLFVFGPGGTGKSTLIAKFILDHAAYTNAAQLPFAYLDFDRAALMAEEPISVLFEIMRQLSIQYPEQADAYVDFRNKWIGRIQPSSKQSEAREKVLTDVSQEVETGVPVAELLNEDTDPAQHSSALDGIQVRETVLEEFAGFVLRLQPPTVPQPLLLVLDTFEEIQFRSSASEDDVFDLLAQLQQRIPRLRTVICGRAEITSTRYKVKELKLGNFDELAALAFLKLRGIANQDTARTIFNQVGGSPLVLRLAADVAKKEHVDAAGIEGLGSKWLEMFRSESVELVLYKRILSHVYDNRVRLLANPGLVLRYVTPEIVLEVLGPACNVRVDDLADARALVKVMRQQLTTILVPFGGNERLAHRPDMRQILLADLSDRAKKDKLIGSMLEQIHLLAVDFYSKADNAESRAEELFHRLYLKQDRAILKSRWRPDLSPYLGSAVRELGAEQQAFVAARSGFDIPDRIWQQAADEDWLLLARERVDHYLRVGKIGDAANLLMEYTARKAASSDDTEYIPAMVDRVLKAYASQYQQIREQYPSGNARTRRMAQVLTEIRNLTRTLRLDQSYAERFFADGADGHRIVGLAIAQVEPRGNHINIAIDAIGTAHSPFEQYQGLVLAEQLSDIPGHARAELRDALLSPKGTPFHSSDPSRLRIRDRLLKKLPENESESGDMWMA